MIDSARNTISEVKLSILLSCIGYCSTGTSLVSFVKLLACCDTSLIIILFPWIQRKLGGLHQPRSNISVTEEGKSTASNEIEAQAQAG
jgi:hypothetical protein